MKRWVGVDPGEKRIGVARSDAMGMIARPERIVGSLLDLVAVLREWQDDGIQGVIVGLPRNMDGSLGPRAEKVLAFRKKLEERFEVPVDTWDERLTSFQAESLLTEAGVRGAERKARVDKVAAQIILQGWLDNERALGDSAGDSPSDNSVGES